MNYCSDVCKYVESKLRSAGFNLTDDEDHSDMLEALGGTTFINDEWSALVPDPENDRERDFILKGLSAWITVENLVVHIERDDDGVTVDIFPLGKEAGPALSSERVLFEMALEED